MRECEEKNPKLDKIRKDIMSGAAHLIKFVEEAYNQQEIQTTQDLIEYMHHVSRVVWYLIEQSSEAPAIANEETFIKFFRVISVLIMEYKYNLLEKLGISKATIQGERSIDADFSKNGINRSLDS